MESASGMMPPACRGRANSMAGTIIIETETRHLGILLRVPSIHIDTQSLNSTLWHLWDSIHWPKSWLAVSLVDLWRSWSYKHFGIPTGKPEPFPCNSHYQEKRSTSFQKQNCPPKSAVFRKITVSVLRLKWQIETQTLIHCFQQLDQYHYKRLQRSNAIFTSTPCMASKTFLSFSFSSRSSRMRRSFKVLTVNLHRHEMEQSVSQGNHKESLSPLAHHGLRILIGHCHVPGSRNQGMHQNHWMDYARSSLYIYYHTSTFKIACCPLFHCLHHCVGLHTFGMVIWSKGNLLFCYNHPILYNNNHSIKLTTRL